MPVVLVTLIALMLAAPLMVLAARWVHLTSRMRGVLMMLTGLGLVAIGLVAMLATDRPEAIAVGVIGLVFIAVGRRRLQAARGERGEQ